MVVANRLTHEQFLTELERLSGVDAVLPWEVFSDLDIEEFWETGSVTVHLRGATFQLVLSVDKLHGAVGQ